MGEEDLSAAHRTSTQGRMFRGVLNTETIRRRDDGEPSGKKSPDAKDDADVDDLDPKTAAAKAKILSSSAEPDRRPDFFDTHVGPFIQSYVEWCQRKGVILGWIPGLVGVGAFIFVAMVVGAGMGWFTGQGIIKVLDYFGLVAKMRAVLDQVDNMR